MAITYLSGQRVQGILGVGMGDTADGTISGATFDETTPPIGDGWLSFDGSNDYCTADGASTAMPGEDHTENAWAKCLHIPLEFMFRKTKQAAAE